jgi:hypothetical protein
MVIKLQRHDYVRQILTLLCLYYCDAIMVITLQHYYVPHVRTFGFVRHIGFVPHVRIFITFDELCYSKDIDKIYNVSQD